MTPPDESPSFTSPPPSPAGWPASNAAREAALRREIEALHRRIAELESANGRGRGSRGELDASDDPVAARRLAEELNRKLAGENEARRRTREALRASEEGARALIANLPGGAVCVVDRQLRYQLAEGEALREAGWNGAEFVGRRIQEIVPPLHGAEFGPLFESALAGTPFGFEHEANGRCYLSRGVPLRNAAGEIDAVLAVSFDITGRRQAEKALQDKQRELQDALERAQEAHRAKDQFIAALSHELRTPLTPILIAAGLNAADPKLPGRLRTQFETIRSNVQLEARLIDDLLDQTEIDRGKLRLEKQLVDAHLVINEALFTVAQDFEVKDIKPKVLLKARASHVDADPVRLKQILWNLLRNAAKFTDAGGSVTVHTTNPGGKHLAIRISDSGIGLTQCEIECVFQPFTQGEHASAGAHRHFGGLGLGLTISRQLIELHGGTIEAASAGRGRGATFTVTLPLAPRPAGRARRSSAGRSSPGGADAGNATPRHALLVEDHAATRAALKVLLGRHGYIVSEAGTVKEALDRAAGQRFDILVSDLGLPDGTGHDVVREMKRVQPDLPAVALSGFGMEADVQNALAAGFSVHLTKPVGVEQLDAILEKIEHAPAGG